MNIPTITLNFKEKSKIIKKVWGNEVILENNDKYCFKFLNIKRGYKSSVHYHKIKDETFYLLKGRVIILFGDKNIVMEKDQFIRIHPLVKHSFIGLKQSKILEVSTFHSDDDSYREDTSKKIAKSDFNKILNDIK